MANKKNKNGPALSLPNGFTLIEIMISIGIMAIILALGLFLSFDAYRGYIFRSEQAVLVSALEHARSRSITNYFESSHGVCYDNSAKNYVLFRGTSYSNPGLVREPIESSSGVIVSSSPAKFLCSAGGVAFEQLTGKIVGGTAIDMVLTQNSKTSTTSINYEGTINW